MILVKRSTHFFTQIPQPIHKNSEMNAILSVDFTSMQSLPGRKISMSTLPVLRVEAHPF
ncbi:hypothetical protein DFJ58DRAFT_670592 [Suillus subalutaceus]|uniref:uncharacterized protein n=1 Tax=Suillus subalutaceus TaxID=48586 RepID=UPI001B868B95|nr:uncharacterized protein DFJ58DRAFT_670592 [Suillus subalutaceus]KAG1834625.1 hypothetical protein DFJ58DRAFT_670592 [Suillus subalutaceus]KAG1889341.1 hypothetical protein F4604DRAFT_1568754 [Suillus subluteus]